MLISISHIPSTVYPLFISRDIEIITLYPSSLKRKYMKLTSKEPPHPGGVSYLLCSLVKNRVQEDPPRRICTRFFEGVLLHTVLDEGTLKIGNPPGGGVSFDQSVTTAFSWSNVSSQTRGGPSKRPRIDSSVVVIDSSPASPQEKDQSSESRCA